MALIQSLLTGGSVQKKAVRECVFREILLIVLRQVYVVDARQRRLHIDVQSDCIYIYIYIVPLAYIFGFHTLHSYHLRCENWICTQT